MGFAQTKNEITISTHTPHARRDVVKNLTARRLTKFQLTRLMRGVTTALPFAEATQ